MAAVGREEVGGRRDRGDDRDDQFVPVLFPEVGKEERHDGDDRTWPRAWPIGEVWLETATIDCALQLGRGGRRTDRLD